MITRRHLRADGAMKQTASPPLPEAVMRSMLEGRQSCAMLNGHTTGTPS